MKGKLISGAVGLVMCLALVLGAAILPVTPPVNAASTVTIGIEPSTANAAVNETFTLDIKITITDSENVSGAQAYINFDYTKLEVKSITKGAAIGAWAQFQSSWNNTAGTIYYAAAAMPSPVFNQTFVLATVELKALGVTESTPLTFVTEGTLKTKVSYGGESVLDAVQNGEVTIVERILLGHVDLQGRSTPESRITLLTVTLLDTVTTNEVEYSVTTDEEGNFVVSGVPLGTYDIRVKCSHTLANRKDDVVISDITTGPIDFGTLLEGDATDDNVVDIDDVTMLAPSFGKFSGEPGFIGNCDFTQEGVVDIDDVTLIAMNFGIAGDIIV